MSVAAVVVAAGQGQRFGSLKQFAALGNETVARRSVRNARSVADKVVLVVPEGYSGDGEGADTLVVGGATRSQSVRSGLNACGDADVVIIHDSARPLATPALFHSVVAALSDDVAGAIPGLNITDTVKLVDRSGEHVLSLQTLARENLVTVQTPQAFKFSLLRKAHANGGEATDDAALIEAVGGKVVVVPGETNNIKITEPGDLLRVQSLLEESL